MSKTRLYIKALAASLFLFLLLLFPTPVNAAPSDKVGCLFGGDPLPCTQFVAAIRNANLDPDNPDPNACYFISASGAGVRQVSCTEFSLAALGDNTINTQVDDPGDTTADTLQEAAANPGRVDCNDATSCVTNNPLLQVLVLAVNILSAAVGVVVLIVIVIAGIQYSTAGGNPNATAAAKKRILNAILALVAYALLFVFFQWLVPGGFL